MQGPEFQAEILAMRPPEGTTYRLFRRKLGLDKYYPPLGDKPLRCSSSFEYPLDCAPGPWLVLFYADEGGKRPVQHVGDSQYRQIVLTVPDCDEAEPIVDQALARVLTKEARPADRVRNDPGVIEAKIETTKRAIRRREDRLESRDLARKGLSKELLETQVSSRFLRRDLHELVELLKRSVAPNFEQTERHYALMEMGMQFFGRMNEQQRLAAERIANPPPPIDYTPVLAGLTSAARDIMVVALQRGERRDKPALVDESGGAVEAGLSSAHDAQLARLTAERDRLRQKIDAIEQNRKSAEVVRVPPTEPVAVTHEAKPAEPAQDRLRIAPPEMVALPPDAQPLPELVAERDRLRREIESRERELAEHAAERDRLRRELAQQRQLLEQQRIETEAERQQPRREIEQRNDSLAQSRQESPRAVIDQDGATPELPRDQNAATLEPLRKDASAPQRVTAPAAPAQSAQDVQRGESSPSGGSRAGETREGGGLPMGEGAEGGMSKVFPLQTPTGTVGLHLPDGVLSGELANLLAGDLWDEGGVKVLPTLSRVQVAEVAEVIVAPPKMTEETARRALASGGVVEALAGLLFFNPAFGRMLRGGK